MLEALLTKDATITEYAIMLFDVRPRWLHAAAWRANTFENVRSTLAELRKIYLEGATNFDVVLADLEQNFSWLKKDQPVTAFLLSDGQITWGQIEPNTLLKRHPEILKLRWICYHFGETAVNQALFDKLTQIQEALL